MALLAGCAMSGPGVASVQPQGSYYEEQNKGSVYNDDWTNKPEPTSIDHLDSNAGGELSADISERELGVRYMDEDTMLGDEYTPAYKKRQQERRDARRAEWKKRMGYTTIKDEQDDE
jgi:hypothetical protein